MQQSNELLRRIRDIRSRRNTEDEAWNIAEQRIAIIEAARKLFSEEPSNPLSHQVSRSCAVEMIAFLEWRVRSDYALLLDHNEENLSRVSSVQKLQFSISQVQELWKHEFTLGDLVSQNFGHSSIDEILKNFRLITGKDGYETIKNTSYDTGNENVVLRPVFASLIHSANKLFSYRHIVCHEFTSPNLSFAEVENGCQACFIFWICWDSMIAKELDTYPFEKASLHDISKNNPELKDVSVDFIRFLERTKIKQ